MDALGLSVSLTDFNGRREKAAMQDQKRTKHPELSIANIIGGLMGVQSFRAGQTNGKMIYLLVVIHVRHFISLGY